MKELIFRRLTIEDLDIVFSLEEMCFSMPWSKKSFEEALAGNGYFYLGAFCGEKHVGTVGLQLLGDEGEVMNVATHPDVRGQGIAKRLLNEMLMQAGNQGIRRFMLEVRALNAPAIAVYKSAGFEEVGRRKKYYHDPEDDAVLMDLLKMQ